MSAFHHRGASSFVSMMTVVTVCSAWLSVARADFELPNQCRSGAGTYDGDYTGRILYSTCANSDGTESIWLNFKDDLGAAIEDGFVPGVIYADLQADEIGNLNFTEDSDFINTDNTLEIISHFQDCKLIGTWKLTNHEENWVKNGTFEVIGNGTGGGEVCGGSGGSSSGSCGLLGGTGVAQMMLFVGCGFFAKRKPRRGLRNRRH